MAPKVNVPPQFSCLPFTLIPYPYKYMQGAFFYFYLTPIASSSSSSSSSTPLHCLCSSATGKPIEDRCAIHYSPKPSQESPLPSTTVRYTTLFLLYASSIIVQRSSSELTTPPSPLLSLEVFLMRFLIEIWRRVWRHHFCI